jgi:hypothetical protein
MDNEFGFYRNRPFYFRSRLPMKRVAELVSARYIRLKRYRKNVKEQQFIYDGVSHTIKSLRYKDRSLNIANSGRSADLQMITTNARWF